MSISSPLRVNELSFSSESCTGRATGAGTGTGGEGRYTISGCAGVKGGLPSTPRVLIAMEVVPSRILPLAGGVSISGVKQN